MLSFILPEHNIKQRYIDLLFASISSSLTPSSLPMHNGQHRAVPRGENKPSPILTSKGGRDTITLNLNHIAPCRAEKAFVEFLAKGPGHALDVAKVDQVALGGGKGGGGRERGSVS